MKNAIRYLRISTAALCGVTCVAVVALWIRSYWWTDDFYGPFPMSNGFAISSNYGRFMIGGGDTDEPTTEWELLSTRFDDPANGMSPQLLPPIFAFDFSDANWYLHMPQWFVALVAGLIAFALAKRRSYSVRTMLIITTLIALALGAIVYYASHADGGGGHGGGGGGDYGGGGGGLVFNHLFISKILSATSIDPAYTQN
jgi:hypothetical protein